MKVYFLAIIFSTTVHYASACIVKKYIIVPVTEITTKKPEFTIPEIPDAIKPETDEVTFYELRYCKGNHYKITLGHGECRKLPEWLTTKGWNLSVNIHNNQRCIKVYENSSCAELVRGVQVPEFVMGTRSHYGSDLRVEEGCKSTKLLGLSTIRSFKRVDC